MEKDAQVWSNQGFALRYFLVFVDNWIGIRVIQLRVIKFGNVFHGTHSWLL